MKLRYLPCFALCVFFALPARAGEDVSQRSATHAIEQMIASAHPLATQAGLEILRKGGNAMDAAIAVQMVLNVVEPQSSGIGGGGFLLHYDAINAKTNGYDGRETAPEGVKETAFMSPDGKPIPFFEAAAGGEAVGTPGLLKMLWEAHKAHGKLQWNFLFDTAIQLAETGFPVSPRLHGDVVDAPYLAKFPPASKLYTGGKQLEGKAIDSMLKNPELAATLRTIALQGIDPFYSGRIAEDMVKAVKESPVNPGTLTLEDLGGYEVKEREPICLPYRVYMVCTMPPPSSGITLLQALGILEKFDLQGYKPTEPKTIHVVSDALRLAFADREAQIGDPDFESFSVNRLLDKAYLAERSALIKPDKATDILTSGAASEPPSTTHISVVDKDGNAVSLTSSIEHVFGSGILVDGFLLNNQMTDFSFTAYVNGKLSPNRVEPGKRPRSSMSPTLVFGPDGKLFMVIGSPGGQHIVSYVLQTLLGVLDWGLDIQQAINQPHYAVVGNTIKLEDNSPLVQYRRTLEAMGHKAEAAKLSSGLYGIQREQNFLTGGADARREGTAEGN